MFVVVFQENVESQSEGWGGDGGSTCERPQKMSPLHLEILFIVRDWYIATKGKIEFDVKCKVLFHMIVNELLSSEMEATLVEPFG